MTKDKEKVPYLFVPDYLHARNDLSAAERDVLGTIIALSKKTGYCYAKNTTFTKVACVKTVRGAQYILAKLKNKGLIVVDIKRYKKSEIVEGKSEFGTVRKIYVADEIASQSKSGIARSYEESFMGDMQDFSHNILNRNINSKNYLENQTSEISNKEIKINPAPLSTTPNEVVFRTMINRVIESFTKDKNFLKKNNVKKSELKLAKKAFLYYLIKYKSELKEEHVRYKKTQVEKCFIGFITHVQILRNIGWPLEYVNAVNRQAIDRWFSSTKTDKNNLLLNHYIGNGDNTIFQNCLEYVGLSWDHADIDLAS